MSNGAELQSMPIFSPTSRASSARNPLSPSSDFSSRPGWTQLAVSKTAVFSMETAEKPPSKGTPAPGGAQRTKTEYVIQNMDGTIAERNSYGSDSYHRLNSVLRRR